MSVMLPRVLVVGGGELGSAVCHRLVRSGMEVVVVDRAAPTCVRQAVCFAMAVLLGTVEVEGVTGRRAPSPVEAVAIAGSGQVAVMVGDLRQVAGELKPPVVVDARMLKRNQDVTVDEAPLVVGLGPGFVAGKHVHVVVETMRGHNLGRLIYRGSAAAPTGVPGDVGGFTRERVIRAPASGIFRAETSIGRLVESAQVVGRIDGATEVMAPMDGLLRGLIPDGTAVREAQKIGDVDPRGSEIDPRTISDRARAVAGGVLEAIMHWARFGHDGV